MLFWMTLITALISDLLHLEWYKQIVLFAVTYLCWGYHNFATEKDCESTCHNICDGAIKDLKTAIIMLQNKNGN